MAETEEYQVILTNPAKFRFQDEILDYIERNFSWKRAEEVDAEILDLVKSLSINPQRGAVEKLVLAKRYAFRFVLYQATRYFEIKVLYHIDEAKKVVFITDFFPTRMNPSKIKAN